MLINIDSWRGAGKSVLLSLLDGHKDVFSCPIHDFTHIPFCFADARPDWLESIETDQIRRLLCQSGYYRFEFHAQKKAILFSLSSKEKIWVKIPFEIDFHNFERMWMCKLNELKQETRCTEDLLRSIYASLQTSLGLNPKRLVATMSQVKPGYVGLLLEKFPTAKTIHIRRSLPGVMATRVNRTADPQRGGSNKDGYIGSFSKRIFSSEIEKICHHYNEIDRLVEKYSEKVLVIDFNDLIINTKVTMRKVTNFLQIDYSDNLVEPSILGIPLKKGGIGYIGKQNDDPSLLLSKWELMTIGALCFVQKMHKRKVSPLRPFYFLLDFKN